MVIVDVAYRSFALQCFIGAYFYHRNRNGFHIGNDKWMGDRCVHDLERPNNELIVESERLLRISLK